MGQSLKRFLESQGAWNGLNPDVKKRVEEGIHPGWDGKIIRNIYKAGNKGQAVDLSGVIAQTIGNGNPKVPPPSNPNNQQNQPNQNNLANANAKAKDVGGQKQNGNGNGNGNSKPNNALPQNQGQNLQKKGKKGFGSFLGNKNLKFVAIGILVLAALAVGAYFYLNPMSGAGPNTITSPQALATPQTQSPEFVMPQSPTPNAIDFANAKWLSPVQIVIGITGLLIIFGLYLDAKERGQVSDAWVTIAATVAIMSVGFFVMMFKGFLESHGFTDDQIVLIVSWIITLVAFIAVGFAAFTGGFDLTPVGAFLVMLAIGALLFGNIGAFQNTFGFPNAPVVAINQMWTYMQLKEFNLVWISMVCYILLIAGVLTFGEEIVRTTLQIKENGEKVYSIFASTAGLIAYAALRMFAGGWPYLAIFATAMGVAVLVAALHPEFGTSGSALAEGEKRLRGGLIPPWDKVSFQLTVGLLLIALTGMI